MTQRTDANAKVFEDAVNALAWMRSEEQTLQRIYAVIAQHPDLFGSGPSALAVAAEHLERYAHRRSNLTLVDNNSQVSP
ncbi:MAG: hypothetical protein AAF662_02750 [Pseudomonadota bacterium]